MRVAILFWIVFCGVTWVDSCPAQDKELTMQHAQALYDKEDRLLNEAWTAAKKALGESEFNMLKEGQREWVEYRDNLARSPLYVGLESQDELPLNSPEYLKAAAGLAEMRTQWLKGLVQKSSDEMLTGIWTDSYGGRIEIVEKAGRLYFAIECVRGPTSHVGELAGIASWNRPIGWFSDKGHPDAEVEEANLSFIWRHNRLEVIGANTGHYHGTRAYFDGTYVRVKSLSEKAQTALLKAVQAGKSPAR